MEGFGWYTYETMLRITQNHPEHTFVFFFDRPYDKKFLFANNIIPIVVHPPTRHPILQKIWFDISLKKALKKYQCDIFVSPDGYLSLTTSIPQIAVIHDLNFEHNPNDLPKRALRFYQKRFPLFAKKAALICTVSHFSKQDIIDTYHIESDKIAVTYNGVSPIFQPLENDKIKQIQDEIALGNPYILFVGAIHRRKNLKRLITAYQNLLTDKKISHHLVIVGHPMWRSQHINIDEKLKPFVHFTGHVSAQKLTKIMGSASCLAFVSYFEGFGIPMLEAMQCGIPVLAGNKTALPEIGGDAVHYCDPYSVSAIEDGLHDILINVPLRNRLREKGLKRAQSFSWDKTANKLWECILQIDKQNESKIE